MATPNPTQQQQKHTIAIIGAGAIGISFTALHLQYSRTSRVRIFDPRPDLASHLEAILPGYITLKKSGGSKSDGEDEDLSVSSLLSTGRLTICNTLEEACSGATIIQEQGPERDDFKRRVWEQVDRIAGPGVRLWSSTSGIAASRQTINCSESLRRRLLVVHPFNPPHIMPLIEIVPSSETSVEDVEFARRFFVSLNSGHRPVVIRKEVPGFVGNRLAFVLFREACSLVDQGVVDVADLDVIMESSLGPRWAVTGPFKSYGLGGGTAGLAGFLENLRVTMGEVWDGAGRVNYQQKDAEGTVGDDNDDPERWRKLVIRQTDEAYGLPTVKDFEWRDQALRGVMDVQRRMGMGNKKVEKEGEGEGEGV